MAQALRRIGRTWYRIDARGVIIGQYADAQEFFADRPGAYRGLAEWWVRPNERRPDIGYEDAEFQRRREEEYRRRREETFTFSVEPEVGETEHDALIRKVQALIDAPGTPGEGAAARAALERLRAAR